MADDDTDVKPEQGIDQRVSSLEAGQESLSQKLDKILGIVGGDGPAEGGHPDEDKGAPNIAHEIRAQLDADAAAKKKADEDSVKDELGQVKAKVAELAEKAPEPMPRRVERIMGWR